MKNITVAVTDIAYRSAQSPALQPGPGRADIPARPAIASVDFLSKIPQNLCNCELPPTKQTTSTAPQPN
jgi:hypothetical protein